MIYRSPQSIKILLVENDLVVINAVQEVMSESNTVYDLNVVNNGFEALLYLNKLEKYQNVLSQDIILMSWQLPDYDGVELLKKIKADPLLRIIPVLVLCSSTGECESIKAYKEYANACLVKHQDIQELKSMVKAIEEFWCNLVALPNSSGI